MSIFFAQIKSCRVEVSVEVGVPRNPVPGSYQRGYRSILLCRWSLFITHTKSEASSGQDTAW